MVVIIGLLAGCGGAEANPVTSPASDVPVGSAPARSEISGAESGIEFIGATTGSSQKTNTLTLDVAVPARVEEGDVLIGQFVARAGPVTPPDAGWSPADPADVTNHSIWVKVATANEPNTYTWMQGDIDRAGRSGVIVAAYRGVDTERPIAAYAHATTAGPIRDLVAPSVEVDIDDALVIRTWSARTAGGSAAGIQAPLPPETIERGRVMSDIAYRAALTFADHVQDEAGPSGEAVAEADWDVVEAHTQTTVLRPFQ